MRHVNALTSASSRTTRQHVIKKAATSGQITATTAIFGRGTDFFCKDSRLEEAGGMKVIQSFLSLSKSEEIQIQGRTARQGKKGAYQLILLESDLCTLLGTRPGEFQSLPHSERYDWLDRHRQRVYATQLATLSTSVREADARHCASIAYAVALFSGDREAAKRALNELHKIQ